MRKKSEIVLSVTLAHLALSVIAAMWVAEVHELIFSGAGAVAVRIIFSPWSLLVMLGDAMNYVAYLLLSIGEGGLCPPFCFITIPLNSLFWGFAIAWLVQKARRRKKKHAEPENGQDLP